MLWSILQTQCQLGLYRTSYERAAIIPELNSIEVMWGNLTDAIYPNGKMYSTVKDLTYAEQNRTGNITRPHFIDERQYI